MAILGTNTLITLGESFKRWCQKSVNLDANRFTRRKLTSSGATTSAGWAMKDWVRCWEGVVALGVTL